MRKIGLIINPVAGMGGSVGLKGSDGADIQNKARELGAEPQAMNRTIKALNEIRSLHEKAEIVTYPSEMGEDVAKACGFDPVVIGSINPGKTKPTDTQNAARDMKKIGVDLIVFAGGDGTARNIYDSIDLSLPVIGIPAGVKIHSAVYGQNPKKAGELLSLFLQDKIREFKEAEVMDIDEDAFRSGSVVAKLYGYLKVPFQKQFIQNRKSGAIAGEGASLRGIAQYVVDQMEEDCLYIIGPGTTTRSVMEELKLDNTLLGVDAVYNKKLIAQDVTERELLGLIEGKKVKIILTIIGGQGHIFGRGNQQLSPKILKKVGKENIIVIATRDKINSIFGFPMLIDTGDDEANTMLEGYYKVVIGYEEYIAYKATS
ncbi:MAG: ATP-NAD kinase family protein [Peptostreptococcaceae bacterium]|nr:ATP-NAD kinase family protein [Peptostreptococcaceae bacterium]